MTLNQIKFVLRNKKNVMLELRNGDAARSCAPARSRSARVTEPEPPRHSTITITQQQHSFARSLIK